MGEHMNGLSLSLTVGFLLAYSSVWLVSRINDRYTQWEKNLCRVLVKRGKENLGRENIPKEGCPMTAYEFYWKDREGREHFLGTLPERRNSPERITEESIEKWGRLIIGEWVKMNNLYFIQVGI